jgi:hypothetical protein
MLERDDVLDYIPKSKFCGGLNTGTQVEHRTLSV